MTDDDAIAPEPTADATLTAPAGWEKRVKDAQAALTRKTMENADLRRRLEALEAGYEADDDDGVDDGDTGEPATPISSRFRTVERPRPQVPESERAVAESVYDADVLDAFGRASALLSAAVTEADRVSALEAYHELRSRATSSARQPGPASRRPTRDELLQPRTEVLTDRPDVVYPSSEPDTKRFEGGQNGGVGGWVRELLGARRDAR